MSSALSAGRPRLSVAMIVRDEQEMLPEALASVRCIADEIVVIDTGSRDATAKVAQAAGARVASMSWSEDFSAARNYAIAQATGDWILWLDAGERLSDRCGPLLREFVQASPDRSQAWLCMVQPPPERVDVPAEQIGQVRLIPRRSDLRFSGRVAESLHPALARAGMTVGLGPWRILRTSREHDPQIKRARAERDLHLIELEVREQGTSPRLFIALGKCCAALGELTKGANYFRQAVQTAAPGSTEMLSAYYGLLTSFPTDVIGSNAQLELCIEALEVFPYDAQLLCAMGGYLQAQGQLALAQRSYRAANQFGQINPETWHVASVGEVAAICLSLNLQLMSDDAGAVAVLEEAAGRFPDSIQIARRWLDVEAQLGRTQEALRLAGRLGLDRESQNLLRSVVRGACMAARKNWTGALASLAAAYQTGCREVLCMRWYTISLLSTGKSEAAVEVLSEWARIEPNSGEAARLRTLVERNWTTGPQTSSEPVPNFARALSPIPAPHIRQKETAPARKT